MKALVSGLRGKGPSVARHPGDNRRRVRLGRWNWERMRAGREVSHEITAQVCFEPRDLWVGLYWEHREFERWVFYLCLVPCLPLRIKFQRSHGGRFG